MFEHYANAFDTVQINNIIYRLPETSTLAASSAQALEVPLCGESQPVPYSHEKTEGS
jgi:hypothetical protein